LTLNVTLNVTQKKRQMFFFLFQFFVDDGSSFSVDGGRRQEFAKIGGLDTLKICSQGTLTEREMLSTIDLLVPTSYF
jgi:hypothetical protein